MSDFNKPANSPKQSNSPVGEQRSVDKPSARISSADPKKK